MVCEGVASLVVFERCDVFIVVGVGSCRYWWWWCSDPPQFRGLFDVVPALFAFERCNVFIELHCSRGGSSLLLVVVSWLCDLIGSCLREVWSYLVEVCLCPLQFRGFGDVVHARDLITRCGCRLLVPRSGWARVSTYVVDNFDFDVVIIGDVDINYVLPPA